MNGFENIIYEKTDDGIAWITLNRPKALNAVNTKMRDELYEVLPAIKQDPDVRVAIVKGAGDRAFSAGADISEFGTVPSVAIGREIRWERDLWGMFLSVQKPMIAAIGGFALGAGIEMAMCCDIRIASDDSQFGLPEANLGMVPTAGGSQTMPRLVLHGRVSEIVLTADRIDASEGLRIGLINRIVSRDQLIPTAETIAKKIISNDASALMYAKNAITRGLDMTLDQGLELEKRLSMALLRKRIAS
ncbi:MAG: enoyl-CoA hydratase/isomerase family protein [Chloroflexi bacterium]|jgi:enoyl-CoA hydratase|nr:enoyl-CoA hydratase/isomerase family protein [Chloroflexota bacterium]